MRPRYQAEFCRKIDIDKIERQGLTFSVEASPEERNALAQRFKVVSIEFLRADGRLVEGANHSRIKLHATLDAEVTQQCVVSLERVVQRINVDFSREYDREAVDEWGHLADGGEDIILNLESDDFPELIEGGMIDVGEVVAEQLALELDPFPRTSEATTDELTRSCGGTVPDGEEMNSFAALAAIREKLKNRP